MFRRLFSKARSMALRPAFRPQLEGLESRWTPATAAFNNLTKTLTVTVETGDTNIDFTQAPALPLGYISAADTGGFVFNNPATPEKFVKNIVVRIPAPVTAAIDIDFTDIAIAGNVTVTSATTGGVNVAMTGSSIGTLKVISTAASADDLVNVDTVALKGALIVSLGGAVIDNTVNLDDVNIGTNLRVIGKDQNDSVSIGNLVAAGTVIFNLGNGVNELSLTGVVALGKTLSYAGTAGIDEINFFGSSVIGGNATFLLGNGDNDFEAAPNAVFSRNLSVTGGIDEDVFSFFGNVAIGGNATFNLGNSAAQQDLDIEGALISGNLSITGGSNFDNVVFLGTTVRGSTTVKLLAGDDLLRINDSGFIGTALFDGAAGEDRFDIEDNGGLPLLTSFGGKLTILGGTEDDILHFGAAFDIESRLTIDGPRTTYQGGLGTDTFSNELGEYNVNGVTPSTANWV